MKKTHPIALLATWFGSGLSPKAPGTMGTLAALPFAYLMHIYLGIEVLLVATILISVIGVPISTIYMRENKLEHDPKEIVIDEVSGIWLTISVMPLWYIAPDYAPIWPVYIAAFVLFRFFDILKPWPISLADRKVHGGFGVMLDDWLAGIMAWLVLGGLAHVI